jgi:hypothetical protein
VGELGYTPSGDTWRTAIVVDAKEAGMSESQLKAMRQMMTNSMKAAATRESRKQKAAQNGEPAAK